MNRIKRLISEKLVQISSLKHVPFQLEVPAKKQQLGNNGTLLHCILPKKIQTTDFLDIISKVEPKQFLPEIIRSVRFLPGIGQTDPTLELEVDSQTFASNLLQEIESDPHPVTNKHFVFEFSSPNIAKPFHVGHLRSTIIGNFLSNLHEYLGYKVTRVNYLGDWGTQFGLLQVGVDILKCTEEEMQTKPIETLFRAYVAANAAAKTDPSLLDAARSHFNALETNTDTTLVKKWEQYRMYTITELKKIYERLGVRFDKYEWESQYSQNEIVNVITEMKSRSLLDKEKDGRQVVTVDNRRIPITRSDGSTLYLVRDIAALLDRYARFNFDKIFYIVENGQSDHFNACFKTTSSICEDMSNDQLHHVKFGRIHGMSTRKGNAVFLRDVLDEAKNIMWERQINSPTTKIDFFADGPHYQAVADILGVSAVIINDLKQRRQRDYDFDWSKALQVAGDTGIKLQYTHCRLHNLLEAVGSEGSVGADVDININYLSEPEALDLLLQIARFENAVIQSAEQLEACIMVHYLFTLCNTISRALKKLNVKNETCLGTQRNRIMLFQASLTTLRRGMDILGLKALKQM